MNQLPPVIFLMGPTASGKTALAISLYQHLACELISVDSTLVYRGMDIGTAKPDAAEQALAPHHLLDIRDPAEPYDAAAFRRDALALIEDICARGKIPILVGGTMLYFKALFDGLAEMPAIDPSIRSAIEAEAEQVGWPAIHAQLAAVDPDSAASIHPNHSQRICRALEVWRGSGKTMSDWRAEQDRSQGLAQHYHVIQLAIAPRERSILHERIAKRFELMMAQGFEQELKALYQRGDLHTALPAVRAVGYRQLWAYLEGECSRDEAVEKAIVATRQLAKRQFTWLRSWPHLQWIDSLDERGQQREQQAILAETLALLAEKGLKTP